MVRKSTLGLEGSIFIPCLLLLSIGVGASLSVWMLMQRWSRITYHQLRINRCVGQAALEFRNDLKEIEDLNSKMAVLRWSLRAARLVPAMAPLIPGMEFAIVGIALRQDYLLTQWKFKQVRWRVPGFCGSKQDRPSGLPVLAYSRGAPDDAGATPLKWDGDMPDEFIFQIRYQNRAAAARVEKKSEAETQMWSARWDVPALYSGADFI